jgi:hypothetical protein
MPSDTEVAQPDAPTAPTDTAPADTSKANGSVSDDPFAVDESQFVSLTPEQRASLDPVLSKWKETAQARIKESIEKEKKQYEPHLQRSQALEKLVKDPRFVKWYHETNNPTDAKVQTTPRTVASAAEWAEALQALAQGDSEAYEKLQAKLVMSVGGPQLQKTQNEMNLLKRENEMVKLFSSHPDAKDLDQIGRENDPQAPSLFELCASVVIDRNGGTWEQAYQMAKTVAQSMENKGKRAAMGLVSEKKGSVTEKSTSPSKEGGVVFVDTMEEAMSRNIEAAIDKTGIKYQVRK